MSLLQPCNFQKIPGIVTCCPIFQDAEVLKEDHDNNDKYPICQPVKHDVYISFAPLRSTSSFISQNEKRPSNCLEGRGAQNWIRTSTSLRTLRPEHSASTNFAIWASFPCSGECKYTTKNHFSKIHTQNQIETLKSRRASFRLVFRSVLALR